MLDNKNATLAELTTGIRHDAEKNEYLCLLCGQHFTTGQVYQFDGAWYDAAAAAARHVAEHGDLLEQLLTDDKKLTEHQKTLLRLLRAGTTDAQIAEQLGISSSTVRQQRFLFREKARAARRYLAIYALALSEYEPAPTRAAQNRSVGAADSETGSAKPASPTQTPLPEVHNGATMVDSRYFIEDAEERKILDSMFSSFSPLRLRKLSPKEKKKIVTLRRIAAEFTPDRKYTEKEVNTVLKAIYPDDHVILRRYLIEYGFMDRTRDGKTYWVKE